MKSIALVETSSIARGVKSLDEMAKRAPVNVIQARPVCPGRYIILIEGEVAAVEESYETGRATAGEDLVDSLFLAYPHEALPTALRLSEPPEVFGPVGVVETRAVASALLAADVGCKTAPVDLVVVRLAIAMAGKSFVLFSGELADVQASVEAAAALAREHSQLVETTVLSNPDKLIEPFLV